MFFFGVKNSLAATLTEKDIQNASEIVVDLNIDGLPIFHSNNVSVWPIQMSVSNIDNCKKPFVVAMFCGSVKPQNNDFLRETVDEIHDLTLNGFNGIPFKIRYVICDAPARAIVKGIVQFNGYYGCDFCDIRGVYDKAVLFLYKGNLRTNESFRKKDNPKHHKSDSLFLKLDIDMVNQFPLDVMHCVDLGVTKRLLLWWKEGSKKARLSSGQLRRISDMNQAIRNHFPSSFNRKPRRLDELKHWKATEYRSFLLYVGPLVLKEVLEEQVYTLFLSLTVAISILSNPGLVQEHGDYAQELLEFFVSSTMERYGDNFCSYNVHCLLHLKQIAQHSGCLGECSAYKFENNMTSIKRSVKGSADPLLQITNRLMEKRQMNTSIVGTGPKHEMKIKENYTYELSDNRIAKIIVVKEDKIIGQVYTTLDALFQKPCDSRLIGMFKGQSSKVKMTTLEASEIIKEVIAVPGITTHGHSNEISLLKLNHNI